LNAWEDYYLEGKEPRLVGQCCTGFVLRCFHEGPQVTDQVNTAYLCFDGQWYRLYFECATVFWRESEPPEAATNNGLAQGLLLKDLSGMESIIGQTVQAVTYEASQTGDVRAIITFASGKSLVFEHSCEADSTRLAD